jgi:large subunit ribosomal protein L29
MKTNDYLDAIRKKSPAELKDELLALRREQFNLRMQSSMGQMNQTHLSRDARKKVARVQTLLNQKSK